MKFRITKSGWSKLSSIFEKTDDSSTELELEPFDITAAQAIRENKIREEGYIIGHRQGCIETAEQERRIRMIGGYCSCGRQFDDHLHLCRKCFAFLK